MSDVERKQPTILSIQVGVPTAYGTEGAADEMDRAWETSFFKQPVTGPRWLGRTNLDGNRQADTKNHGGRDKAALCYSAEHYPRWRADIAGFDPPPGGFGENFTIAGQSEETVCLGDTYAIGDVRVQVSQPRGPCWKIERRWRMPGLTARVRETGRTGWYFRVLASGTVEAGMTLTLLERPCPEWTIAQVNAVINNRADREGAAALAACPYLAFVVRRVMMRRVAEKVAHLGGEKQERPVRRSRLLRARGADAPEGEAAHPPGACSRSKIGSTVGGSMLAAGETHLSHA